MVRGALTAGAPALGAEETLARWRRRKRIRDAFASLLTHLVLVTLGFILMIPFFWMVSSSLKPLDEVFLFPPQWLPSVPRFANYPAAINDYFPFWLYAFNTVQVTLAVLVGRVFTASLTAYGFARLHFRGRGPLFILMLSTMMVPEHVTMIPTYILFKHLQWLNTYVPLILPAYVGGGAFSIFLMRQFIMTIPQELDDAARIDGCSWLGVYWRIVMPLCLPALAALAIFAFMGTWNDFIHPLIYLNTPEKFTLAIGLRMYHLRGTEITPWNHLMAASIMVLIPPLVLFFFAQRFFIQGVVVSGLKG
ncbi:MAG: carbohydrate ABC transporter permease [Chloroflexi bacterium]|nr:carbohydrate ABC transporter permease [Chloroflexota bacterium]